MPGEKAAQAQLSRLSTSTDAASFEGFLAGSWVETLPDQPHPARSRVPSVLSFDPRARKIAFSQGDTQEVYTWRDTLRTLYNRAYLIGDNETVPQISRTFAVTAQSAITLSVSIQSIDSGDSAPVTYGRIADETQARILAQSGSRAAPALPPLDGEYSSTDGLTLDFHSPRLSWSEHGRQRSAEYVLFPLDGKVILSARFFGDERSGDQNYSWTVDFKESKAPTGTVRSLTLSPAQLTVQGYEDAVGDTLSLEQDVDLRPGRGTGFQFLRNLPEPTLRKFNLTINEPQPHVRTLNSMLRTAMKNAITILVVDDDMTVRDLIRTTLERESYKVRLAANGLEALDAIAANFEIACVVTDVVMPKMDGITLAMKLHDARPTLPIVIVSGQIDLKAASIQALAALMNSAPNCLLKKPFTSAQLVEAVRQALARAET